MSWWLWPLGLALWSRAGEPPAVQKFDLMVETDAEPLEDVQPSISPDGTRLAYIEDGVVHVRDFSSFESRALTNTEGAVSVFWSPDSSRLVFTSWAVDPQPMLYDVASGEVTAVDMVLYVLGWSPDGRSIVGQWPDGVLTMADVTDPTAPVTTPVEGVGGAEWPSWQPRP